MDVSPKKQNDLFNVGAYLRSVIVAKYYCLNAWDTSATNMLLCVQEIAHKQKEGICVQLEKEL